MILPRIKVFAVKAFRSRFYDKLRQKVLAPWCTFYPILGTNSHIDASPYGEHLETQNAFSRSVARLTIRPYVIPEANRSSDLDSFVSAVFASVHDLALGPTTSGELARKLQAIHRWGSSRSHFVGEPAGSNDSHPRLSIGPGHASLGELQDPSLWGSSWYQELHRWGSLHGSSRHHGVCSRQKALAGGTGGCCGGVLERQPPQWQVRKDPLGRNRRKED